MPNNKQQSHIAHDRTLFLEALPLEAVAQDLALCPRTGKFCEKIIETFPSERKPRYYDAKKFQGSGAIFFPGLDDPCTDNGGNEEECGFEGWQLTNIFKGVE